MLEETEEDTHREIKKQVSSTKITHSPSPRGRKPLDDSLFIPYVSIPRTERRTDEKDREYVIYVIEVNDGAWDDIVLRRYNEFAELNETLHKMFPETKLPSIPAKTLFKNSSKEFVEQRRVALEKYLQDLIRIDCARESSVFSKFLTEHKDIVEDNAYWSGKRICILGASSGIGEELASQYAGKGAVRLALVARREDMLQKVAERCRLVQKHVDIIIKAVDLSKPENCKELMEEVCFELGGIDILIFCVGIGMHFKFEDIPNLDVIHQITTENYYIPIWCMHYALSHLIFDRSTIIVVTGQAGKYASPSASLFAGAKHALHGFFDTLREEQNGILNIVLACPSSVDTPFHRRLILADGTVGEHKGDGKMLPVENVVRRIIQGARYGSKQINIDSGIRGLVRSPGELKDSIKNII